MKTKNLLLIVFLTIFSVTSSYSQNAGVPISEYNFIIELFNESLGTEWLNNSNWLDTINYTLAEWYGITVENGHVAKIILSNNNLSNKIPASIENLTELQFLDLSNNNIEGPLPVEMGNLKKLEYLNLEKNAIGKIPDDNSTRIARQIPDEIGNINSLRTLILSWNFIHSNDLEAILAWPNFPELTKFSYIFQRGLYKDKYITVEPGNDITITMEYYFPGNYDKIQWYKNNEAIPGANSPTLELKNVEVQDEGNYFCTIRNTLATAFMTYNYSTTLTVNGVHGAGVPVSEYKALEAFYNLNNGDDWHWKTNWLDTINCTVDEWDGVWTRDGHVIYLGMDSSNVLRILPQILTDLVYLEDLSLFNNTISGELPSWIGEFSYLKRMSLFDNYFSGEIPGSLWKMSNILYINLSGNQLSGNIPFEIGDAVSLEYLNLSDNNLSGNLPTSLGVLNNLNLILSNNQLSGNIPAEIGNATKLKGLSLNGNKFSGSIPESIGNLNTLQSLNLSNNNLSDTIPSSIEYMGNLRYLNLEKNELTGTIPASLGNLNTLQSLNLSKNQLSGTIPSSIGNMDNLGYLNLEKNELTGTIPANLGNLPNLCILDLSNNQLMGPLPVELENLINIYRFDIDNNLIGNIDFNKSAVLDNNRQIPDELASLIQMDTLYLGGNNLQFNDIEAIFSWENYSDFKDFIYYPQDSIGNSKTIEVTEGDTIELKIENYYPGPSDKYQWYKGNSIVSGATNSELWLSAIKLSDAGEYYCKITNSVANELILTSRKFKLAVTEKEINIIPATEYVALKTIREELGISQWIELTNWLDTLNVSPTEWFGITFENGHIRRIDLSNKGLTGDLPVIFSAFDSLSHLDISGNRFYGYIPLFSGTKDSHSESAGLTLAYLNIANNNYTFSDLEPIADKLLSIDTFIYSPQQMIGVPLDTTIYSHDSITFELEGFTPGENDQFKWMMFGEPIEANQNKTSFKILNATKSDNGLYNCIVTNEEFPDLTLYSNNFLLEVHNSVGIINPREADIEIYPNPAEQKVFVETKNHPAKIEIVDISGQIVFKENDFQSDWINTESFSPGIYLFRINTQTQEIIRKKVIFK